MNKLLTAILCVIIVALAVGVLFSYTKQSALDQENASLRQQLEALTADRPLSSAPVARESVATRETTDNELDSAARGNHDTSQRETTTGKTSRGEPNAPRRKRSQPRRVQVECFQHPNSENVSPRKLGLHRSRICAAVAPLGRRQQQSCRASCITEP